MNEEYFLKRAKYYPYERPEFSYVFDGYTPGAKPKQWICNQQDVLNRTAVIAHGSNQSDWQLQLKRENYDFGTLPIYVQRVWLHDYDVLYAARITSYGAVPATLSPSTNTSVDIAVTWLSNVKQRDAMDESEGRTTNPRSLLPNAKFDDGTPLATKVYAYRASVGILILGDEPIALASVRARNRYVRQMTEEQVLEEVRKYLLGRWRDIEPNLTPPQTIDDLIRLSSDGFANDDKTRRAISNRRRRINNVLSRECARP